MRTLENSENYETQTKNEKTKPYEPKHVTENQQNTLREESIMKSLEKEMGIEYIDKQKIQKLIDYLENVSKEKLYNPKKGIDSRIIDYKITINNGKINFNSKFTNETFISININDGKLWFMDTSNKDTYNKKNVDYVIDSIFNQSILDQKFKDKYGVSISESIKGKSFNYQGKICKLSVSIYGSNFSDPTILLGQVNGEFARDISVNARLKTFEIGTKQLPSF